MLEAAAQGSRTAINDLLPVVYAELRRMAAAQLDRERAGHTLQPTALVHEAYLKLVDQRTAGWTNRAQFFGVAAQAMRRILVDHARSRGRIKRGGEFRRTSLDDAVAMLEERADDLVALDEALGHLSEVDPKKTRLVEMRFFAGLSAQEAADFMGVSLRTAERDWALARSWLRSQIARDGES
jgi:RNA polymerase sigma-70 factor, ECF subfamily